MDVTSDIKVGRAIRPSAEAATMTSALFTQHRGRIYRLCLHNLRSSHDAEDAVQQTFVNALQAIRSGVTPTTETAWLLHIARNVCLERQRNAGRRARIEFIASPDSLAEVASSQSDGDGSDIAAALGRLDARHREALILREWRGLSYREIAGVLQLSQSAVEALLFRARRSLARALEDTRRLRPTFNWGSLFASGRTAFSGAAAKTTAIVACCGITAVGVPVLENAVLHRDGRRVADSPLSSSPAAAPVAAGVAAAQPLRAGRENAIRPQQTGETTSTVDGSQPPGAASGTTPAVGGTNGSGSSAPATGSAGAAGATVAASSSGTPPAWVEQPLVQGPLETGVSAQVKAGGVSAQVSAGDTSVAADVAADTDNVDAAVQVDVGPPVAGSDAPSGGSPDVSAGVGVSAGASDTGAVAAGGDVTVDTGLTGAVGVDLGVHLSLP